MAVLVYQYGSVTSGFHHEAQWRIYIEGVLGCIEGTDMPLKW